MAYPLFLLFSLTRWLTCRRIEIGENKDGMVLRSILCTHATGGKLGIVGPGDHPQCRARAQLDDDDGPCLQSVNHKYFGVLV
jgi:hypothetical protein